MKGGPGKMDMRAVNYLFAEGKTLKQVSAQLSIAEEGLKPFMPKKKATKAKAKPKAKAK